LIELQLALKHATYDSSPRIGSQLAASFASLAEIQNA
jgi:hypothetical protein